MNLLAKMAMDYAMSHREFVYGALVTYGLGHIPVLVRMLFGLLMRLPWLRALVQANPDAAKKIVEEAADELKADIEAEAAAKDQATPPSAPATGPPPA